MPHKRAKRSVREKKRAESGSDLPGAAKTSIEDEEIPKSAARVLNAAQIQQAWAEKKRKGGVDDEGAGPSKKKRRKEGAGGEGAGKTELRIQPGESIAHFNRRVEDSMRHSVREAMQSSSAKMRKMRKEELERKATKAAPDPKAKVTKSKSRGGRGDSEPGSDSEGESTRPQARAKDDKPKDFEKVSTSAPRRLNDIVQAPPDIKKLPRKAKKLAAQGAAQKTEGAKSLREGVLSMAQKAMMEEERERVIRLYREMKKGRTAG